MTTVDNICTYWCHVCGQGRDVGKSYAHCITKTKLILILIPTLTLTLLTLLPFGQSWVCSNLGPPLRGLPDRHPHLGLSLGGLPLFLLHHTRSKINKVRNCQLCMLDLDQRY